MKAWIGHYTYDFEKECPQLGIDCMDWLKSLQPPSNFATQQLAKIEKVLEDQAKEGVEREKNQVCISLSEDLNKQITYVHTKITT